MRFKKVVLIIVAGWVTITSCVAQYSDSSRYEYTPPANYMSPSARNNSISIGFGMGGYYPYTGLYYAESPNFSLSYEHITFKHIGPGNISLGALLSYTQIASNYTGYNTGYNYTQEWNYYVLGARVVYRISAFPSKLIEPYAGTMLGYYVTSFRFTSNDPNYSEPSDPGYYLTSSKYPNFFAPTIFAGISTRFSSRGSAWLEAGYGYTDIEFGLNYKI